MKALDRLGLCRPYLSDSDTRKLDEYKYHSGPGTKLDNILNTYWWTPVSELVPRNIHPNVLTVAALASSLILSYIPLLIYSSDFLTPAPRWVYASIIIGFFLYQTLDAIDGKQARRTGLSSPTGQMMDHGCDSLTTFYSMFIICAAVRLGHGPLMCSMVVAMTLQLYMYSWWECTYGVFRSCTGEYFGVTEGQYLVMFIALVGLIDPTAWTNPLGHLFPGILGTILNAITFNVPLQYYLFIVGCGSVYNLFRLDMMAIWTTNKPKDVPKAIREWGQLVLQAYANAALILGGVVARHPFLSTMMMACAGSLVAWRLILSSVAKANLRILEWPSYPFIGISILTSLQLISIKAERLILLGGFIWCTAALFCFVGVNMTMVRDYLGTSLFTVPVSREAKRGLKSTETAAYSSPRRLEGSPDEMLTPETCETSPVVTN